MYNAGIVIVLYVQVLRFEDHPTPCLAVAFAPWDPQLLVFCEDKHRVYVTGKQSQSCTCAFGEEAQAFA